MNEQPMTIVKWLITFLLLAIPVANIILLIVWASTHDVNKSKKTFCQAYLICIGIAVLFYLVLYIPQLLA